MQTDTIDNKAKNVISNIRSLPTPPIVFHQIQKVTNDDNASATRVAAVLAEDPAMSVKVLKLTNSAFYGLAREVDSVKQAVVIVGMEAIKNLVLSSSVLDMFKGKDIDQGYQDRFWRHSLATACCSRLLARKFRARAIIDGDTAFSAGLLHDIGKLIICCFLTDEYKLLKLAREKDTTTADHLLENQTLGFNHAVIGGYLAVQWKLPQTLADSISYHHEPQDCETGNAVPYLIHLANFLAKKTLASEDDGTIEQPLDEGVLEFLKVADSDLEALCDSLREEYSKAETFMQMAGLG